MRVANRNELSEDYQVSGDSLVPCWDMDLIMDRAKRLCSAAGHDIHTKVEFREKIKTPAGIVYKPAELRPLWMFWVDQAQNQLSRPASDFRHKPDRPSDSSWLT